MTPYQSSKKSIKRKVCSKCQQKGKKIKLKCKLGQLVRTADNKKVIQKADSTNYSYKLYTLTKVTKDTIPSYRID